MSAFLNGQNQPLGQTGFSMNSSALSDAQIEQFLTRAHVTIKGAFSREAAQDFARNVWNRLGYDERDRATWAQARIHLPSLQSVNPEIFAPRAFEAICQLCGGRGRVQQPVRWGDSFIVNLGSEDAAQKWQTPAEQVKGWHKDGDFFRHFLDSPEQGLLVIVLWSDIVPRGGGTFVACDSVPLVARFLRDHPEGMLPNGFDCAQIKSQCRDFVEVTGRAGDVILLHPFTLHAASENALRLPRLITNPPVHASAPFDFNRANSKDYSPVERAILQGLGVEKLDFAPTAARERIEPERVRRERAMLEAEVRRAAQAV